MANMTARIRVEEAFDLASMKTLIFLGYFVDGVLRPGMSVHLPAGVPDSVSRRIDGLGRVQPCKGPCKVELRFIYGSAKEREFLRSCFPIGSVMELSS